MATAAEIRNKALKKLGVLAVGNTASAEISTDMDAAYAEVYAELATLNLTPWDFDEEVPDALIHPVVALVAYARLDEYNVPSERHQRIFLDAKGNGANVLPATAIIKSALASNVYVTPQADYF